MTSQKRRIKGIAIGVGILLIVILLFFFTQSFMSEILANDAATLREMIASAGVLGPIVFMLLMALAIIISPIPSLPLDAVGGILWGPYLGTLYAVIGAEIGAIIAFLLARLLGRVVVEKMLRKKLNLFGQYSDRTYGWVVFIARLFPFFQFDVVSYGAGLTSMKLRTFAIATFFGMIPVTFLVAFFGETLVFGGTFSVVLTLILILAMFLIPPLLKGKLFKPLKDQSAHESKQKN